MTSDNKSLPIKQFKERTLLHSRTGQTEVTDRYKTGENQFLMSDNHINITMIDLEGVHDTRLKTA